MRLLAALSSHRLRRTLRRAAKPFLSDQKFRLRILGALESLIPQRGREAQWLAGAFNVVQFESFAPHRLEAIEKKHTAEKGSDGECASVTARIRRRPQFTFVTSVDTVNNFP
jgi:hypothetical protein